MPLRNPAQLLPAPALSIADNDRLESNLTARCDRKRVAQAIPLGFPQYKEVLTGQSCLCVRPAPAVIHRLQSHSWEEKK